MTNEEKIIQRYKELTGYLKDQIVYGEDSDWEQVYDDTIKQITELEVKPMEFTSCKHPAKYQFTDRDGNLRCSDCHKVIKL